METRPLLANHDISTKTAAVLHRYLSRVSDHRQPQSGQPVQEEAGLDGERPLVRNCGKAEEL